VTRKTALIKAIGIKDEINSKNYKPAPTMQSAESQYDKKVANRLQNYTNFHIFKLSFANQKGANREQIGCKIMVFKIKTAI